MLARMFIPRRRSIVTTVPFHLPLFGLIVGTVGLDSVELAVRVSSTLRKQVVGYRTMVETYAVGKTGGGAFFACWSGRFFDGRR